MSHDQTPTLQWGGGADTYLVQLNTWTSEETADHVTLSSERSGLQILTDLQPEELQDWAH